MKHNDALSGEQRRPPNLKYCAANTETEANQKCRALEICLKRIVKCFVAYPFEAYQYIYGLCKIIILPKQYTAPNVTVVAGSKTTCL
ncbi:hypothetical protein CWO27_22650 [Vibrio sp. 10N.286.51.C3]|nr:hypothetical protein CWO27_22650 [Vibrio sp. 10N.286.51.C3]TKE71722.1 hypothetical protein FCV45_07605 [Vibrio sp. F12]TKE73538.1 hypothetical protein FCV54_24865 [Vibrio sp. F12]